MLYEKVSWRKKFEANYMAQYFTKGRSGSEIVHNIFGETIEEVREKVHSKPRKVRVFLYDVHGDNNVRLIDDNF